MSTKRTPDTGWELDEQSNGHFSIWASAERDKGELIATVYDNSDTKTALRRAEMIKAAPEMYDACEVALDAIRIAGDTICGDPAHSIEVMACIELARRQLVAVLAKAEGRGQ